MRVFIAIDINEQVRKSLERLQQELKSKCDVDKRAVKWVRTDNIHLTLKFLGEVKDQRITEVCRAVEQAAKEHKQFDLDIESVGHFGGKSARVIWVGAGKGKDNLVKLQKDIEEQLAAVGFAKEAREFTGHLTVCRIKNYQAGVKLATISREYESARIGAIAVESVCVYQSDLMPQGPVYTVLGNYKLKS